MKRLAFFLLFLAVPMFGLDWSRNHVYKINQAAWSVQDGIADDNNIDWGRKFVSPAAETNSWLRTLTIEVGEETLLKEAFINMEKSAVGFVRLTLHNADDDSVIASKDFYDTGRMDLINVFERSVYLTLDFFGSGLKVYSFGVVRKPMVMIVPEEVMILPEMLFYSEESLAVQFELRYPAYLDILVFDQSGRIIDYAARKQFFREGPNLVFWNPEESTSPILTSGLHLVYFRVKSMDGKTVEIARKFLFVKQ